ncbi:MAG: DUF177 domain-containing protein [Beijerinckiaceae bacterium]|nr:DUF177 domain-containing protein [Beijerinckiaceae bacterium]
MTKTSNDRPAAPRGPFSRPLRIRDVPEKTGLKRRIEASAAECEAIALDAGLPAVLSLAADFHIAGRASGRFDVTGHVEALVTQICVVTLEPFDSTLSQDVSISFALPARGDQSGQGKQVEIIDIADVEDPPDPIFDNTIDLGAVALEFLTLARDFYPKKPGVHFAGVLAGEEDKPEPSTFAALERFREKP